MALGAGAKLGHYEIVATLGAGGMGEVYRGHDSRLGRDVAIKVLPESFARDPGRLGRFSQEARAVAALNHPNILGIYDVGSEDGVPYLVCEFLKGETLRERMEAGALPLRRAQDYARQMATGLAAAHESGVVHRDLKPENVFITADGQVKLLDFGLAKLNLANADDDRTRTRQTEAGTVMGTAGYMSPEQVRGQAVDHRSDIFSLGVVLYEMLSGTRAFTGDSSIEVMNEILKADPPPLPSLPGGVAAVLEHCLQKNPAERFQSARDLAFALAALSGSSSQQLAPIVPPAGRLRMTLLYGLLGLLVVALAVYGWRQRIAATANAPRSVTFDRLTDFVGIETAPAISPDGKSVAFVADVGGKRQIWVQLTAGGTPLQLTQGTGEHLDPRWAQNSASILYYSPPGEGGGEGAVWEISALGGGARKMASSVTEADVSHDGTRLVFFRLTNDQTELVVSDRDGLNPRVIGQFPNFSYSHPRWSPDDHSIAYDHASAKWSDDIFVVPATGGPPRQITREGILIDGLAWLPDGSGILYSSARGATTLYLPVMHLWTQALAGGDPRQISFGDNSYTRPDVGRDGRIVTARWRMQFDIWKFPVVGNALENARRGGRITAQTGQVQTPTLSPDDNQVAFLSDSGNHGNIWIKDLHSGDMRQLTYERDPNVVLGVPVWSPDGSTIAFATSRYFATGTDVGYWAVRPDGSDLHRILPEGSWAAWSPDGHWLYYSEDSPTTTRKPRFDIMKIAVMGGTPQTVRSEGGASPMLSPDGNTLYYVAPLPTLNGHQDYEVRRASPESGPSTLLFRIAGERLPIWQGLHPVVSHDGKWLALTLNDEYGTNLWLLSTTDGKVRRAVDFGQRRTFIARRVSWSRDDRYIYAAVGEGDADIVSLQGVLR